PHLDDEAVLDHRMVRRAGGTDDVDPRLGVGPGEVLEQPGAVVGVDLDLDPIGGLVLPVPADVDEAVRVALERLHVLAVGAVDREAAPQGHVAGDLVAGDGAAALGEPHGDVAGALDPDPVGRGLLGATGLVLAAFAFGRDRLLGVDALAGLQPLHDLVG